VRGADLKDGLLAVELVREIPEAMKPRKIEIGSSSNPQAQLVDRGSAANSDHPSQPEKAA
jgi:molecular chaperone IbpA